MKTINGCLPRAFKTGMTYQATRAYFSLFRGRDSRRAPVDLFARDNAGGVVACILGRNLGESVFLNFNHELDDWYAFKEQSFYKLPHKPRKATIKSGPESEDNWGQPRKTEETLTMYGSRNSWMPVMPVVRCCARCRAKCRRSVYFYSDFVVEVVRVWISNRVIDRLHSFRGTRQTFRRLQQLQADTSPLLWVLNVSPTAIFGPMSCSTKRILPACSSSDISVFLDVHRIMREVRAIHQTM